jgi:DNA-binding FadR family transcriptional regulator
MLHLLEVRRLIEIRVAQKAAESATDEEIRQLEEIWSSMCGLVDAPAAFAEKDLEFHLALARASGNPLYGILLEPLTDVLLQLIFVGSNIPGTAEEACGFHKRVLEAVKARDVIGATEAMTAHLQQTERVTIQGLQTMKTRGSK